SSEPKRDREGHPGRVCVSGDAAWLEDVAERRFDGGFDELWIALDRNGTGSRAQIARGDVREDHTAGRAHQRMHGDRVVDPSRSRGCGVIRLRMLEPLRDSVEGK